MPSALVAALAAPIREVQALVGPGWSGDPAGTLMGARDALTDVSAAVRRAWRQSEVGWSGTGADAAAEFAAATVAAVDALSMRAARLGTMADQAGAAVERARDRLQTIVEEFEARAAALEPYLDSPGGVEGLMAEARRSLEEAVAVVEELRAELDGHAAALAAPSPTSTPAATTPAGMGSAPMPSMPMGSGSGGGAPVSPLSGLGGMPSSGDLGDLAKFSGSDTPLPDAAAFGDGFAIRLPDGSTAMAPNALAASAVRYALTQLGVPYQWGGTAPGVGLDCSGLTQWAYHEAGLELPRLAQEQDVGAAVSAGSLRPGDLAVWDGHVAMIVGNGTMIEAGDPVKLSPIRTTNAGQGFQGFWRPTG
ncbi:exonuclease VII small subunit [Mycobacterium sp. OAS707]|uniref:C40 family peptidase n=1 Tax=Mycobacterium sp. OAS707 TaxID=2663822 RepID=UPI001789FC25|nr:C40 family peptidase [Mycobacterium sp. OAS707]MBE1547555.1 exonuclease VII small subunit [Mycobacterium sp. OAS707]